MSIFSKRTEKVDRSNEDIYFEDLEEGANVQIFLIGGVCLTGIIMDYDDTTLIIYNNKYGEQLIYKHAISTISIKKDN